MNRVYAVGVILANLSLTERDWRSERYRLCHFYAKFEDAEHAVLNNWSGIFEDYYNLALIEEHYVFDPSDPPIDGANLVIPQQWWYIARFEETPKSDIIVEKIEQPECFKGIINFWAG